MDRDNKKGTGASSDDTTSALFVSARKKQLEQQEADRRAKEKEDQRLAAEAEVRRLEREVEERRQKAEADKKAAEEEARRIAQEARAKQAQAAENPDTVLGARPEKKDLKMPKMPKISMPEKPANSGAAAPGGAAKAAPNIKILAVAGGGAALVLILVFVFVLAGKGSASPVTESGFDFSGIWYDASYENYTEAYDFQENGKFLLYSEDSGDMDGTYEVDGENIVCRFKEPEAEFTLTADGVMLNAGTDAWLMREGDYDEFMASLGAGEPGEGESDGSGASEGSLTFTDPDTGFQIQYPEGVNCAVPEEGSIELTNVEYNGWNVYFLDMTEIYDETMAATNYSDELIARAMTNTFMETSSTTLFDSDWATAAGTKDFTQAIEEGVANQLEPMTGRNFDTVSRMVSGMLFDWGEATIYSAVHVFHDSDLKVFTLMIWDGIDAETSDVFEDVISTMRISAE
jgi:hypothetical protein